MADGCVKPVLTTHVLCIAIDKEMHIRPIRRGIEYLRDHNKKWCGFTIPCIGQQGKNICTAPIVVFQSSLLCVAIEDSANQAELAEWGNITTLDLFKNTSIPAVLRILRKQHNGPRGLRLYTKNRSQDNLAYFPDRQARKNFPV